MTDFRGPLRKDDYKVLAIILILPTAVVLAAVCIFKLLNWIGL